MLQGRPALYHLLNGKSVWPPVVVPFGLDPFGWHGDHASYKDVCDFAREHCTLLPKVSPVPHSLAVGEGTIRVLSHLERKPDGTMLQRHELSGADRLLWMEEVQTPGDASWKIRKRWIEHEDDLKAFLRLTDLPPAQPDIHAIRKKERQVGESGLPYVEVADAFFTVVEMFPTETFFMKILEDRKQIEILLALTETRILQVIEVLCRDTGVPFILRMIGAELAVPPFLRRKDFLKFQQRFYQKVSEICHNYGIPAAFHCHGPISDVLDDIWDMGYALIEPFEPPPKGNVTIAEALVRTKGHGIVFGGVDEVIFNTGDLNDVRTAVKNCLDGARKTRMPYILSQTATPFYDPLSDTAKKNLLLFMELGTQDL